jgi:tetratricopeptide (TPR) repeat protein
MEGDGDLGVSPYASGGGGIVLEHAYGAVMLSSLLTGDPVTELGDDATVTSVRFQARRVSPVDDLLVSGKARGEERQVSIGVRRAPKITAKDKKTARLLASYVQMVVEHWEDLLARRWRLCLAVAVSSPAVTQLRELTVIAGAAADEAEFRTEVGLAGRTDQVVRSRLEHVDALIASAAEQAGTAAAGISARELTWRVLYALTVRVLRLEGGDLADRTHAVSRLRQLTADETAAAGDDLFARVAELAGQYASTGREVGRDELHADLGVPLLYPRSCSRPRVSADAMLRGPVAHLGLTQQLDDADDKYDTDPAAAAGLFGLVADRLQSSPFAAHAARIRARQADAFRVAGDTARAVAADLALMAAALSAGDPGSALAIRTKLAFEQPDIPAPLMRPVNALAALAAYEHNPAATLESAAAAFDATEPDDPYRILAATFLAEHAIAAGHADLVRARAGVLSDIAGTTGRDDAGRLADARLRACIADATRDWVSLARSAKMGYPPRVAALLLARHGRHLAMMQDPPAAIDRYNDAIEKATEGGAFADAADWQYAIRLIRISYGVGILADLDEPYRLAQASQAAGDDRVLPSPMPTLDLALSDLLESRFPDALAALRRYRRRAVALADWRAEREAGTRLGDVYAAAGEKVTAIRHYITCGANDQLTEISGQLPEEPLPLPIPHDLAGKPPWERAACYVIAGSAADLLTDPDAVGWAAAALAEFTPTPPVPSLTVSPSLEACKAFALLASAATQEQARQFLSLADRWVDREPNHYRHTDAAHAEALVRIAGTHRPLRPDAVTQMCRALVADQRMAEIVLNSGARWLRAEPAIVSAVCAAPASDGHLYPALAIIAAGADPTPAVPAAKKLLSAVTSPHVHVPGHIEFGGSWQEAATLTRVLPPSDRARLADAMTAVIGDTDEPAVNRQLALAALATIGRHLSDPDRDRFFPLALQAACGDLDAGTDEDTFPSGELDRFRVIMGDPAFRFDGLLAAAALASTPGHYESVIDLAYELMPHASPRQASSLAGALALLPEAGQALLDPRTLAAHESEWIRATAARLWCAADGQPPQVGHRLATDPSGNVRRSLAFHLPSSPQYEDLRKKLEHDIRRSVRIALRTAD